MSFNLGCDIGGTFTDFVLADENSGEFFVHKCLTTPGDPSSAVEEGVTALDGKQPGYLADTRALVHGTTLVINSVIERKGAVTGLLVTEGFKDVLEIGLEKRFDGYDLQIRFPEPLVPRSLRVEIPERIHATGKVLTPLDEDKARAAIKELLEQGVESVAVCLLHSYCNADHENRLRELIREQAPDMPVSLSSEVLPEMREYERSTTTCINAYCWPLIERYLSRLDSRLAEKDFAGQLLLMLSAGGITSKETAKRFPVQIIESGPAAGAMGAAHFAAEAGISKVLAFDMGGTTAKLCLVQDGRVAQTTRYEVAREFRFKKGSGIPVRVPVVDLIEIGAGGGSIAKVSEVGTIQVGPQSSGAEPGPACYGRGGSDPTVSDADLLLGYLDSEYFLGGTMKLDVPAAEKAMGKIGGTLDLSVTEAAWGTFSIVNENMASAAKVYVTEHGEGTDGFALVAFGGAGPVHACDLARRIGIEKVIIPPNAGVASAFGMIVAPMASNTVRTHRAALASADFAQLESVFKEMAEEAISRMPKGVDTGAVRFEKSFDMRYEGQGFDADVPLGEAEIAKQTPESIRERFNEVYTALYGRVYDELGLEIVNLRLTAILPQMEGEKAFTVGKNAKGDAAANGKRDAFCPQRQTMIPHTVYRRENLPVDFEGQGPAIVEERESTAIVPDGGSFVLDGHGSLVITLPKTGH